MTVIGLPESCPALDLVLDLPLINDFSKPRVKGQELPEEIELRKALEAMDKKQLEDFRKAALARINNINTASSMASEYLDGLPKVDSA